VDLTRYPYETELSPVDFTALSPEQSARAKAITTDYVRFLFVSPCDPAGAGADKCLWAFVHTLFKSEVAVERSADPKVMTLYRIAADPLVPGGTGDTQFVRLMTLPEMGQTEFLERVSVSGKTLVATHWVTPEGEDLAVPMLWLAVNDANQAKVNAEYYQAIRTTKEVKLFYDDLQAEPGPSVDAYFALLGFEIGNASRENHYFIARRNPDERDVFTALLKRVRVPNGGTPETFDWMGYTIRTLSDSPVSFSALRLDIGKDYLRGNISR
jgi:hypothetical protein